MLGKFSLPKNSDKYLWTRHAIDKMRYYGLSEQRVRRIMHSPSRVEDGVAPNTVAVMQPLSAKKINKNLIWKQELWVMWQWTSPARIRKKVISAWRYPCVSENKGQFFIPEDTLEIILNKNAPLN